MEEKTGRPLSPYALTKQTNEAYAETFDRVYGFQSIGLRYFNLFGPVKTQRALTQPSYRDGSPGSSEESRSISMAMVKRAGIFVSSRMLCRQISWRHATANEHAVGQVFNVACGQRTTLNELFELDSDHSRENPSPCEGSEADVSGF